MPHHHELHRCLPEGPEPRPRHRRDQEDARGAHQLNALPAAPDPADGRLLWHCRRGMKELDVVLERFVRASLPHASGAERHLLAQLLALPDPELAEYLLAGTPPRAAPLAPLVARIRAYVD
ncbi:MAG: succinate dehydrogenase assembly factor 2 [Steroidobacterales bacterium]